jgi:membrane-bound serine protease (ClpP class)
MEPNYLVLAYLLIVVGFVLMAAELFIPSFGILTVLSIAAIGGGIFMVFYYGDATLGVLTLVGVFIALPTLGSVVLHIWPRTALGRRFVLAAPGEEETLASTAINKELEQLRGRLGRALSPLRPSGVVDFDGQHVDCLTEGMMVEEGEWVRCLDVRAGRVLVRPVPRPNLSDLETQDFNPSSG